MSKKKKKQQSRIVIYIVLAIVVLFGCFQARAMYIKSKEARAAEEQQEKLKKEAARVKKNEWVKKDGKSYYYGEDGKVMTGRFVLKDEKKICYADDNGVVTRIVDGTKPMVAITYDDGPSKFTGDFVDLFQDNNSAATFFEVGNRIKEFEESEKKIAESYCELANHTYSHQNVTKVSISAMQKQISDCDEKLREMGETTDKILFRAPEGALNESVKKNLDRAVILWSVDTMDWHSRNADSVYKIATTNIKDGDIILMHSLYESTLNASKRIVPELLDEGFQLVTVSDLAEFRGGLKDGEKYFSIDPISDNEKESSTAQTTEGK